MDKDLRNLFVLIGVIACAASIAATVQASLDSNIKIACYEAAKTNQNITCEVKK